MKEQKILNPFHPGIECKPEDFIGRELIIEDITNFIFFSRRMPALVSVVGPYRSGKSSLLLKLEMVWKTAHHVDDPVKCLYFNCLSYADKEPWEWVMDLAFKIIEKEPEYQTFDEDHLRFAWQQLYSSLAGKKTVLLIDEFQVLGEASQYRSSFFSRLRALLTHFSSGDSSQGVCFVTGTKRTLEEAKWSEKEEIGSPFPNMMGKMVRMPLFEDSEVRALFNLENLPFLDLSKIDHLAALAGPHPHYLHLMGSAAFAAFNITSSWKEMLDLSSKQFKDEARPTFNSALKYAGDSAEGDLMHRYLFGRGNLEYETSLKHALLLTDKGAMFSQMVAGFLREKRAMILDVLRSSLDRYTNQERGLIKESAKYHEKIGNPNLADKLRSDRFLDENDLLKPELGQWIIQM